MRQMRKWQKQYGNRADPRQHVNFSIKKKKLSFSFFFSLF
jgi:hypothetical protein